MANQTHVSKENLHFRYIKSENGNNKLDYEEEKDHSSATLKYTILDVNGDEAANVEYTSGTTKAKITFKNSTYNYDTLRPFLKEILQYELTDTVNFNLSDSDLEKAVGLASAILHAYKFSRLHNNNTTIKEFRNIANKVYAPKTGTELSCYIKLVGKNCL